MASRKMPLMACLIIAVALFKVASATIHIVGDGLGWEVPPSNVSGHYFSNWSHSRTFRVLDILVFEWAGRRIHTVAEVTRADYECCSSNNPLDEVSEINPTNITLNANGTRYFICTIGSHCKHGQKVAIHVGKGNSLATIAGTLPAIASSILIALSNFYI